jgi:hypothetical protein
MNHGLRILRNIPRKKPSTKKNEQPNSKKTADDPGWSSR